MSDMPLKKLSAQERFYMEAMGKEALFRQQELARISCHICGAKNGNHAALCSVWIKEQMKQKTAEAR